MPVKETAEIETGMAEKFSWDQANIRQKLGLVWRIERKLAKLSKTTFTTVFPINYFMSSSLLHLFLFFNIFLLQFPDCGVQAASPDSHGV
jgi:hypothetical protein